MVLEHLRSTGSLTARTMRAVKPARTRRSLELATGTVEEIGVKGAIRIMVGTISMNARSTVAVRPGNRVAVLYEGGDSRRPVVIGVLQDSQAQIVSENPAAQSPVEVEADGRRITLSAENEIVLRCGHASITLTRAGKVIIRGKYLLSRSSGVNQIKGGSVQIN